MHLRTTLGGRFASAVTVLALGAGGALAVGPVVATAQPVASGDAARFAATVTSIGVHGRGNGHGHGMSQYGAQGAALAGLTSAQIVAFYYPGTTLTSLAASSIRVSVSGAGDATTVFARTPGLTVTGYGTLPTSGFDYFRLRPYGSGLTLGGRHPDGSWHTVALTLPSRADFSSSAGFVRLQFTNGTSTRYRGSIGAVRSGSGLLTINRVSLDGYTEGVAPREMPASWRPAAVGAQAIAARTYGRNAVESHTSSAYDICDTTSCQVYGGMTHFSSGGSVLWNDDPAAIAGNENKVLQYGGKTIFAQFSASNGGAMLSGGLPYLPGKADPYDNASSGDPYLGWADTVSASSIAGYYGLSSVSAVQVTQRNGYGPWGGWVLAATVTGTSYSGETRTVSTTGSSLASAMGVRTSYFHFDDEVPMPGRPLTASAASGDAGATVSWTAPSNVADADLSGYTVHWGHRTITVPVSAHSAYISPINQNSSQTVWVRAVNSLGAGPSASVEVHGVAAPAGVVPLSTRRLFDSTDTQSSTTAANPYTVDLAGRGSMPATGATTAQLAVTVLHTSAAGHVDVYVAGSPASPVVSIPYQRERMVTQTISVPLRPTSTLVFVPSAGSVDLVGEQQGYTAAWGRHVRPVTPTLLSTFDHVATDGSSTFSVAGAPGYTENTKAVLLNVQAWTGTQRAYLEVWPDDQARPQVIHVSAAPWGPSVNTVLVHVPANGLLHLATNRSGIGARVTMLGLVGNGGGGLEAVPANPLADDSVPTSPSRWVGPDARQQVLVGHAQTPATGVSAVVVQFSVTATHEGGKLWAWPRGTDRPDAAAVFIAKGETQTVTTVMMVGADGDMTMQANTPGLYVSIRSMGYLTSSDAPSS